MQDPLNWSLPLCRVFGIQIRVHFLFFLLVVGLVGRAMPQGYAWEALEMSLLLFVAVLVHEFGHCFGARQVDGEATDILIWPLGGLAQVRLPHEPRAHLWTVLAGPLVNAFLCMLCALALMSGGLLPPAEPFFTTRSGFGRWFAYDPGLIGWHDGQWQWVEAPGSLAVAVARFFYVNWILFWFNILLVGFPMDGGRIVQALLGERIGFNRATAVAVYCGYAVALLLGLYTFITFEDAGDLLLLFLAVFIYLSSKQHQVLLETGILGDEGPGWELGTSMSEVAPRPRRRSWWQRWRELRAERRRRREEEIRQAEERRMDELLAKVQQYGLQSLTKEEQDFLKRVSARLRDRYHRL